ncbi:MAG: hypothetical protein DME22_05720 [Verrucomicrobia bacterium]|nr:MAG: hypothetical protein DME22_05720 [Verrucomicrobiota bacterium]
MSETAAGQSKLTREQIVAALTALNRALAERGVMGEICLFGGAVMVLAFNARLATKDVDAVFQPAGVIRELTQQVAAAAGLPVNWLNDGVKGYLSVRHEVTGGSLPQFDHLRLTMPTAEYLLAMKCLASRIGAGAGEADDTADIIFLIRHLGLRSPQAVMDIVCAYYPPPRIPVKAQFLVESLFEERRI